MKIKVTHEVIYDTNEQGFITEFKQSVDDYPATLSALEVFIKDRFINPNFDKGTTTMEIVGDYHQNQDTIQMVLDVIKEMVMSGKYDNLTLDELAQRIV